MTRVAPDWLVEPEVGLCPCGCIGRRSRAGFVDRTLSGSTSLVRQAMFGDVAAAGPGLLQRLDARVKLVTFLGLLVVAALVRHIPVLVGLYLVTLVLATASRLPVGFFVKRVWLFVPLFTAVVVAPATLNVVTPGSTVVPLGTWFGHDLAVTRQGLLAAGLIVSRVAVSISLVVLLTLTTRWVDVMAGLRGVGVPRMFVQVMGMAYRYLFHLLGSVEEMYTARKARVVKTDVDVAAGRAFVSASAGALFGKAQVLSEEVHQAMVSRGYTGDARLLGSFRVGAPELAWIAGCVALAVTTFGVDGALGR